MIGWEFWVGLAAILGLAIAVLITELRDRKEKVLPMMPCPDCGGLGYHEGGPEGYTVADVSFTVRPRTTCFRCGGKGMILSVSRDDLKKMGHDVSDPSGSHRLCDQGDSNRKAGS